MEISAQQLAELLIGVARAQAAIVNGLESAHPGTRGHIVPAVHNVAHLRDHPAPTLVDLPVRVLLSHLSRAVPDADAIARELERLCAPGSGVAPDPDMTLDFAKALARS
jgi:hypothetical protein